MCKSHKLVAHRGRGSYPAPMRSLVPLLALCSCGGPTFDGTWRGELPLSGNCSDGRVLTGGGVVEWVISSTGHELTITPDGGGCGSFSADTTTASTADVRPKMCPGGGLIESGSLTLEAAGTLRVSLKDSFPSGGASCSELEAGTLTRAR